ncbi:hypothetical protein SERLADRAFT_431665 [Serpula lacrymans var. lacrymans S7.9]|nr:uncharacterized protein SERLADRAFT_431665 [Serpula lacrymans var. lacrymans S7.9]EGO30195.1 hypothetical protein SERLADRAFT_431665 [Serpula lacrymans var. lacrymans S7.9]
MLNLHYRTFKTLAARANIPEPHNTMQPTSSAPPFISVASASLPSLTAEHPLVQHLYMPARLAGIKEGHPSVTLGNSRLAVQDVPTEDPYCMPGEGALCDYMGHSKQHFVDDYVGVSGGVVSSHPPPISGIGHAEGPYYTPLEGPLYAGQGPLHYPGEQVHTTAGKGTSQEPPPPLDNYTSSGRAEDLYHAPGEGVHCVEDGASHYQEQGNVTAVRGSSREPPPPVNNYVDYWKASTLTIDQEISFAMGGCIRDNGMSLTPWKMHTMQDSTKNMVKQPQVVMRPQAMRVYITKICATLLAPCALKKTYMDVLQYSIKVLETPQSTQRTTPWQGNWYHAGHGHQARVLQFHLPPYLALPALALLGEYL